MKGELLTEVMKEALFDVKKGQQWQYGVGHLYEKALSDAYGALYNAAMVVKLLQETILKPEEKKDEKM